MIQREMREEIEICYTRIVLKPVEVFIDRRTQLKKAEKEGPLDLSIPEVNDDLLSDSKLLDEEVP